MVEFGLLEPVREMAAAGMPVFGTCAGMVLLARDISGSDQPRLGLMHARVQRNAFGRQVDSFETDLDIPALGEEPYHAVFIRAPYLENVEPPAQSLATFRGKTVMARQGNLLATAFHPELTDDLRLHRYFVAMVQTGNMAKGR
jgi:5'-phosphate synthase pdxT subunit